MKPWRNQKWNEVTILKIEWCKYISLFYRLLSGRRVRIRPGTFKKSPGMSIMDPTSLQLVTGRVIIKKVWLWVKKSVCLLLCYFATALMLYYSWPSRLTFLSNAHSLLLELFDQCWRPSLWPRIHLPQSDCMSPNTVGSNLFKNIFWLWSVFMEHLFNFLCKFQNA